MRRTTDNKKGIQIGDNTHNHGHAITLISLRPTKRTASNPMTLIPLQEKEKEDLTIEDDGEEVVLREEKQTCQSLLGLDNTGQHQLLTKSMKPYSFPPVLSYIVDILFHRTVHLRF